MPITINLETHPFASKFFLKGKAEGKAEGEAEGKAKSLLHLLQRRFNVVPKRVVNRVQTAEIKQIDRWFDEAVDAPSLEAIFEKPRARKPGNGTA